VRTLASRLEPSHPLALSDWDRSLSRLIGWLARAVSTSVYAHHRQLITVKRLDGSGSSSPAAWDPKLECLPVDSAFTLRVLASEIPETFRDSVAELMRRVTHGCVVFLVRRAREDGAGHEIIGYEISERGVFSALGRRHHMTDAVVFSHYAEVLPEHRGQRIHGLLFATRDAYFRERGGRLVVGVCFPQNHASLKALRRDGAAVVGTVGRITLFRILGVWRTPFEKIESALRVQRSQPSKRARLLSAYVRCSSAPRTR
jgi:GNAT superfamily N-acetyltransferase